MFISVGLSRAGRPHHRDDLASIDVEADIAHRGHRYAVGAIGPGDRLQADEGRGGRHDPNLMPRNSMPAGRIA